jgi:hypothetical protein
MHRPLLSTLLFLSLACAHAPEPADAATPALQQGSLESGGRTRTFLFSAPAAKAGEKLPLVIGLHGRLGDGKGQDKLGAMSKVAAKEGFVLALPDGHRRSWHDALDKGIVIERVELLEKTGGKSGGGRAPGFGPCGRGTRRRGGGEGAARSKREGGTAGQGEISAAGGPRARAPGSPRRGARPPR